MHDNNYTIVTVAHEADFAAMQLQARSMALYCPRALVNEIIVIENFKKRSRFSWRVELLKDYGPLSDLVNFIPSASLGFVKESEGWWSQQLLKLLVADKVKTNRYLVLDAKNHLIKPLDRMFLQDETGRARICAENYSGHPLEFYLNEVCRYFGLDRETYIQHFITTAPPFLMDTKTVKAMMLYIAEREGQSFASFFLERKNLTEFFLYGGYLASTGELEQKYELNDILSPTIWAHIATYEDVKRLIAQSQQSTAPFFGIHRTAFGEFNPATIDLIANYWLDKKLFQQRCNAVKYLTALQSEQRRVKRSKFLTSLPHRIASRIKRMFKFSK